jgi:hypothetical protein
MLEHKNGARLHIYAIGHKTYDKVAAWHYVARVEWIDETVSERVNIVPSTVYYNSEDEATHLEYAALADKLIAYLERNGTWLPEPKQMRYGRRVHWVANSRENEEAL